MPNTYKHWCPYSNYKYRKDIKKFGDTDIKDQFIQNITCLNIARTVIFIELETRKRVPFQPTLYSLRRDSTGLLTPLNGKLQHLWENSRHSPYQLLLVLLLLLHPLLPPQW
jgi:hypothetical protein